MFPEPVMTIREIADDGHFIGGAVRDNFVPENTSGIREIKKHFEFHKKSIQYRHYLIINLKIIFYVNQCSNKKKRIISDFI